MPRSCIEYVINCTVQCTYCTFAHISKKQTLAPYKFDPINHQIKRWVAELKAIAKVLPLKSCSCFYKWPSLYFWHFWTPPTHLISTNTVVNVSKSGLFLDPITQSFCWHNIGMVPKPESGLQEIPTSDFSTPDFSNINFSNPDSHGIKKFMVEWSGVEKSGVEMSCYTN